MNALVARQGLAYTAELAQHSPMEEQEVTSSF